MRSAGFKAAIFLACTAIQCAQAQTAAAKGGPTVDASGLLQMMLSLLLVIGLIVGLSWVVGRVRGVRLGSGSSGNMSILAELVIGPRERIVLVRVGDAQALLGVSSAGVNSLTLLDRPLGLAEPAVNPANFAQKLREAMNRTGMGK